jgi:HemY protein
MIRGLIFFVKLAVVVAVAVWLAERPGDVMITWLGYRVDTSMGMMVLAALILGTVSVLLWRLWRNLTRAPREVGRAVRGRRESRGYQALTQGMVSVAAGEPDEARRYAQRANKLLDNPALTHLLSAQAAQLNGEDSDAREHYRAMLDDPETRFLGLRGLFRQAQMDGDLTEALSYVRQARDIRPETPWVLQALCELSLKTGDIDSALEAVTDMQRHGQLNKDVAKRRRGVLLTEKARRANAQGDVNAANDASKRAVELVPDLPAAAVIRAEVRLRYNDWRKAVRVIETAWEKMPHPDLVEPYLRARHADTPASRYRNLSKLTDRNPGHPESERALGRLAMEAESWREAREHLTRAGGDNPSEGICRLMAELEERENGDQEAARQWLIRAADAPPDPAWICESCGAIAASWQVQCSNCDAFDSFAWRTPSRVRDELGQPATYARLEPQAAGSGQADSGASSGRRAPSVPDAEVEETAQNRPDGAEAVSSPAGGGESREGAPRTQA